MWTRGQLKNSAKEDLKGFYWLSVGASFLVNLLSGGATGFSGSSFRNLNLDGFNSNGYSNSYNYNLNPNISADDWKFIWLFVGIVFVIVIIALIIGFGYSAFLSNPLRFGLNKFYVHREPEDRAIGTVFSAFKKGTYMSVVKTLFMKDIIVFLWSLLFIIPGWIKSYAYRLVPYIINDHPELDYKEALRRSQEMTDGEKFSMFVLDLSFIGWSLLTILTCGIGILFLNPYVEATWAQFYLKMCEKVNDGSQVVLDAVSQ